MKKIIPLTVFLFTSICFSQQDSIRPLGELSIIKIKERREFVNEYVKRLNSYSYEKNKKIPEFFYKYHFDIENKRNWLNRHTATSLRKLIIDKINNVELLENVLKSRNRFIRKCKRVPKNPRNYEVIIPYQEYSTYDLVKLRLQQIINDQNMGKRASNYPTGAD